MTNLQALKSQLINNQKSDDELGIILELNGFDPNAEYIPSDKFNNMIGRELLKSFTMYQNRVSEGGYTVEFEMSVFKDYIRLWWLDNDMGNPFGGLGNIKNATNLW